MLSLDVELVGESVMVSVVSGARDHNCHVNGILILGLASVVAVRNILVTGRKNETSSSSNSSA